MNAKYYAIVPLERLAPAIYLDLQKLYNTQDRTEIDQALRRHCRLVVLRHWRLYPTTQYAQLFQPTEVIPIERDYTEDEIYLLCRLGFWEKRHAAAKQTGFLWEDDYLKFLQADFRRTCFECAQKTRPQALKAQ